MTDRVTQDLAMIARNAIDYIIKLERQRNTLLQALKRIEGLEANGDYRKLASDCQEIAYAAIKAVEAPCAASGCNYPQGECLGVCRA